MKNANKRMTKIIFIFVGIILMFNIANQVQADFMTEAGNWFVSGNPNSSTPTEPTFSLSEVSMFKSGAFSQIVTVVNAIGTSVIAVVAVILGIKYLIGTARGKSEVKDQLIGLLVACLLFFGWSNISSLFIKNATFDPSTGTYTDISAVTQLFIFEGTTSIQVMASKVFAIAVFIGKIIAIIVTMYLGVKYIFSGANGKAELKEKGPMFIIGILLVFCTLNVLSFISDIILNATSNSQQASLYFEVLRAIIS